MSEKPRLRDMEIELGQLPPHIDVATALIASIPPEELIESTNGAYRMAGFVALARDTSARESEIAEAEFDRVLSGPSTEETRKEARLRLERLLADEANASDLTAGEYRELELAQSIDKRRRQLAKPLCRGAALVSAVLMGGLGGTFAYMGESSNNHRANAHLPVNAKPVNEALTEKQILGAILFTGGMAVVGAAGGFSSVSHERAGKFAHERAKRAMR